MFRYDNQSISQREQRGFSWANHSLIAVAHRLLRPVNAHRKQDQKFFINVANVDFKYVTMAIVLVGTALCVFYIYCMPSRRERTNASDAPGSLQRIAGWTWFFTCVLFLCFTFPLPAFRAAQASGSTLMACLLLLAGIGWSLRTETRKSRQAGFSLENRNDPDLSTIR
jgi:ABC-type uncharacterized transport system permease subunit